MLKEQYLKLWQVDQNPEFLNKYLLVPSLLRLKKVGYFCGMDYASRDIYDFSEYVSRYDHSLSTALITWYFTKDKKATIAALFHDISTPCFSHVIDYMNKDYSKQESTEEKTNDILKSDNILLECLKEDNFDLSDISDFKKYTIVDLDRPKLCADRLDGIFLTGLFWTKTITILEIKNIILSLTTYINEDGELELGFTDKKSLSKVLETNSQIDKYCHSKEDNYMMELLANITREGMNKKYYTYDDLYTLNEDEIFKLLLNSNDSSLLEKINRFKIMKEEDIPEINIPFVKKRKVWLLLNGERIKNDKF